MYDLFTYGTSYIRAMLTILRKAKGLLACHTAKNKTKYSEV